MSSFIQMAKADGPDGEGQGLGPQDLVPSKIGPTPRYMVGLPHLAMVHLLWLWPQTVPHIGDSIIIPVALGGLGSLAGPIRLRCEHPCNAGHDNLLQLLWLLWHSEIL